MKSMITPYIYSNMIKNHYPFSKKLIHLHTLGEKVLTTEVVKYV